MTGKRCLGQHVGRNSRECRLHPKEIQTQKYSLVQELDTHGLQTVNGFSGTSDFLYRPAFPVILAFAQGLRI